MKQSKRKKSKQQEEDDFLEKIKSDFGGGDKPKQKINWYVKLCRKAGKMFKASNVFQKEDYKLALDFLGWDVKPREVNAIPLFGMFIGGLIAVPLFLFVILDVYLGLFGIIPPNPMFVLYAGLPLLMIPFFLSFYLQNYPVSAANSLKMKSVTYIPEIINYMVMSMKLSPNLEKAVDFAAEHGKGKIAEDLKTIAWKTKVGEFNTIEEGLDDVAYKWGKYSDEFKHALMVIRSSVIEVDEAKRDLLLEKAVNDTLESMKENMGKYAAEMRQPSIYLYYVGVLLPLLLIIMLPIGSAMAGLAIGKTIYLILMYDIGIPLITILFARTILAKRPPVYTPPKIPDNYPGLPKKNYMKIGKSVVPTVLVALISALIVFAIFNFAIEGLLNPYPPSWDTAGREAYFHFFRIAGIFFGFSIFLSIYLLGQVSAKRKIQLKIMRMEKGFQDSIYILASRLGENRPMEEAMGYTAGFMKENEISEVFNKADENVNNLGMTVEGALFDPTYGALKNVPSTLIRGGFRIIVDSISLGVQHAARSLISLSLQLRDAEKIKEKINSLLQEITSMMKSIAFFIAPLVLGITSALQKIIIDAMGSACGQSSDMGSATSSMSGATLCKSPDALAALPSSQVFLIIIAIYVVEVTIILLLFTSKIEEGDNDLAIKINIAKSLPIALFFFFVSAFFAAKMSLGG